MDRHLIKIIGNTKDIENLADGETANGVRSSVRKWRALQETPLRSHNTMKYNVF